MSAAVAVASGPVGFLRRIGAFAIDLAILYAIEFVVFLPLALIIRATPAVVEETARWPLAAAYFVWFWSRGRTPAMRRLRLRLVRRDGQTPGLLRAAVRFGVLGGCVWIAGQTLLMALAPYVLLCVVGFYPHDVAAGTVVRDERQEVGATPTAGADREGALSRVADRLGVAFFLLMVGGVVIGVLGGGIGDADYSATVRNDAGREVSLTYAFDGGAPNPYGILAPGATTSIGRVGGPRESPILLLRAFDADGTLLFCRRLSYGDYRASSTSAPISIRSGDIVCR